jgi:HSP20 family protein
MKQMKEKRKMEPRVSDRLEGRALQKVDNHFQYVYPRCEIRESSDDYIVIVEMPGVNKDGLSVTVNSAKLTVEGKMTMESPGALIRSEIPRRNYRRTFVLTEMADTGNIQATWKDGLLVLHIGKKEAAKPHEIEIKFK